MMENKLFAYFDINPTKAYPVVYGATYTETFNETINSFNLVIDMVQQSDRIYFDRPYHFCKIVNKVPSGEEGLLFNDKNSIIMLVDTFVESLNMMGDEKMYRYEIGLMNCVKLLEKIQCPNLMITHSLITDENESIATYIDRYMKLYCPKVKMSTDGENWSYEYLLNWDNICGIKNPNYNPDDPESEEPQWLVEPDPLFDIPAADMQMNEPTLREVITNLMSQVACIPVLNYRTLSYINFREIETTATITDTDGINFISHSGASDSYASDLIASPSQTLQEKNTVVSDIVGFRDSDNAVVSQTKNLQLEVRYPIYKIRQVRLRTTDNKTGWFTVSNQSNTAEVSYYPIVLSRKSQNVSIKVAQNIRFDMDDINDMLNIRTNFIYRPLDNDYTCHKGRFWYKLHICKLQNDGSYQENYTVISKKYIFNLGDTSESNIVNLIDSTPKGYDMRDNGTIVEDATCAISSLNHTCNYERVDLVEPARRIYYSHVWFEGWFEDFETGETIYQFIPMSAVKQGTDSGLDTEYVDTPTNLNSANNNIAFSTLYPNADTPVEKMDIPANIGSYINITPCIVEQGRRRLLNTDYLGMQDVISNTNKNLSDLAKFIYGTMGYTIGDTKITGFSETYSRAQMWWNYDESYFDTILSFINARKQRLQEFDYDELEIQQTYIDYKVKYGYESMTLHANVVFHVDYTDVDWIGTDLHPYSKMKFLFYIYYQPLNNFKYKTTKEGKEFPFAIEQLQQSADGLNDFERLVKNLQDVTNRIGNPVKAIPQTTDNLEAIKPLNSIYNDGFNDFTIFQRQFSINENYITVSYTASEDYVIKNYFTSIITKYRAYQYVDYNAAIVRKENIKIHGYISDKHYYDGDDKLRLFNSFYHLDDLREILGVSDLTNYISYNDEAVKNLKYFKDVLFRFNAYLMDGQVISGDVYENDYQIGWYITCGMDLSYFSENTKNISSMPSPNANISIFSFFRKIPWPLTQKAVSGESIANRVNEALNYYGLQFYNSLLTRYQAAMEQMNLNTASMSILRKMNDSVLENQGHYYRIKITETPASDTSLESDFALNTYPALHSIFKRADSKLYSYYKNAFTQHFYSSHHIYNLRIKTLIVNIQLVEITDEKELNRIVENQKNKLSLLLSGATQYDEVFNYIAKYVIKSSENQTGSIEETKNEINTLYTDKGFAIYYQDYDNVSAGPQLISLNLATSDDNPYAVGGYVQKWQLWNQDIYGEAHQVFFTYQISMKQSNNEETINNYIAQLPVINAGWEYQPYTLFQIVDNNKSEDLRFTFYKDISEILNQTLQVEYYGDDLLTGLNFVRHNKIIGQVTGLTPSNTGIINITGERFELKDDSYDFVDINNIVAGDISVDFDPVKNKSFIEFDWDLVPSEWEQIKIVFGTEDSETGEYSNCYDIIAFKRNNRTGIHKYYLTLNDTKTNDVWYFSDPNDLFETYECVNMGDEDDVNGRQCKPKETI